MRVARPRRSRRTLVIVAVLVLLSVTLITFDARSGTGRLTAGIKSVAHDVFAPIVAGVNDVLRPIGDFFAGSVHYGALQQENQRLQATIGELRLQLREVQGEAKQQKELHALEGLPYLASLKTVTAQMINFDVSNFDADITISKGRDQGVTVGEPVVGAGGLVGQVVEASHTTAVVQLITDPRSSVGVAFGPTNQLYGQASGQGTGKPLAVGLVPAGTPLHRGEKMYTNGLNDAQYPPGIPVGSVASFRGTVGGGPMVVTIDPLADLGQLAYVAVVQWSPGL